MVELCSTMISRLSEIVLSMDKVRSQWCTSVAARSVFVRLFMTVNHLVILLRHCVHPYVVMEMSYCT